MPTRQESNAMKPNRPLAIIAALAIATLIVDTFNRIHWDEVRVILEHEPILQAIAGLTIALISGIIAICLWAWSAKRD